MSKHSINPINIAKSAVTNRQLIATLAKREIQGRYKGSIFGVTWSFINPLLFLGVYSFVFGTIFKASWGAPSGNKGEFSLVLFSGLLIFNLFAEIATKAPQLILQNSNYIKKVIFPVEILVMPPAISSIFHFAIGLIAWLFIYVIVHNGVPPVTAILLPLVLFPLTFVLLGIGWILASIGVYIRDISQFIGPIVTITMFLSPVFYPKTALPPEYQSIFELNPLTTPIEVARDLLIWGNLSNLEALIPYTIGSMIFCSVSYAWFQKTRNGFSDVL